MKPWILLPLVTLLGCSQITDYRQVEQQSPPSTLEGIWQTEGPQSGLVSPDARAQLVIDAKGNTLDCRQWQRVIAKPGKFALIQGQPVNLNRQLRVMPLELEQDGLHYDKLRMKKVAALTPECQEAALRVAEHPLEAVIENIPLSVE